MPYFIASGRYGNQFWDHFVCALMTGIYWHHSYLYDTYLKVFYSPYFYTINVFICFEFKLLYIIVNSHQKPIGEGTVV